MIPKPKIKSGFTIIELMIATLVFGVVLLLCMIGLIQIGRVYYKGLTITRVNELSRNISDEISGQLQFGLSLLQTGTSDGVNGGEVVIFCVGDAQYGVKLNRVLGGTGATGSTKVFLKKSPVLACDTTKKDLNDAFWNGASELMLKGARVTQIGLTQVGSLKLYSLKIGLSIGEDDMFEVVPDDSQPTTYQNPICKSSLDTNQFCATSFLTSQALRRTTK